MWTLAIGYALIPAKTWTATARFYFAAIAWGFNDVAVRESIALTRRAVASMVAGWIFVGTLMVSFMASLLFELDPAIRDADGVYNVCDAAAIVYSAPDITTVGVLWLISVIGTGMIPTALITYFTFARTRTSNYFISFRAVGALQLLLVVALGITITPIPSLLKQPFTRNAMHEAAFFMLVALSNILLDIMDSIDSRDEEMEAQNARVEDITRAVEARSSFIRYVFHEARTPFNSLHLSLDLLCSCAGIAGDSEARELLAICSSSSASMLRIFDSVLTTESLELGRYTLEFAPVELRSVLEEALVHSRPAMLSRGARLDCIVDESVSALVLADRDKLGQVLLNLLTNAAKFLPDTGGRVVVRLRYVETLESSSSSSSSSSGSTVDGGLVLLPFKQHPNTTYRIDVQGTRVASPSVTTVRLEVQVGAWACGRMV